MKNSLLLLGLCLLLSACHRSLPPPEPEDPEKESLYGTWVVDFTYLPDGNKDPNKQDPYALLEFEYSDSFTLKAGQLCDVIWQGNVNAPDLSWSLEGEILTIHGTDFVISDFQEDELDFATPKGHKYRLVKQ